jgi:hypothetical protein
VPLVAEILIDSIPSSPNPLQESHMWTDCAVCGSTTRLHLAILRQTDPLETVYLCPNGCGPILLVGAPGVGSWRDRDHGMGTTEWLILNPQDLFIQDPAVLHPLLIPASPHALD